MKIDHYWESMNYDLHKLYAIEVENGYMVTDTLSPEIDTYPVIKDFTELHLLYPFHIWLFQTSEQDIETNGI
jgi:hypothetical protein